MAVTQAHIDLVLERAAREGNPKLQLAPTHAKVTRIPKEWAAVLASENARTEVVKVVWAPMAPRLRRTLREFKRSLQGVAVLTTDSRPPSIVYFFTVKEGDLPHYYRGFAPAAKLPPVAKQLPDEFVQFYRMHDGWVDAFQFLGPSPSWHWHTMSNKPKEPAGKFLIIFVGNGGDLLGYDLRETPPPCYLVTEDEPPEVVPKIWSEIDKWVSTQLEFMLPAK